MEKLHPQYIPSLDGIRAVAAMLVFASHAGLAHLIPGGFGVTIFFFLSGYLITTLLRQEYEKHGTVSLKKFYLRRIYRIFPPMYLVLFLILLVSLIFGATNQVSPLAVLAQVFHLTNYYLIASGSESTLVPFTAVYWSLAVEEHFYLVFPLLFLFFMQRYRPLQVARILVAICAVVLAWRFMLNGFLLPPALADAHTFYSTDTRVDSLLFGCIMGVWANPVLDFSERFDNMPMKIAIFVIALATLLFTLLYRDALFQKTLRYTLQGMALFPIFWLAVKHAEWPIFRWLNWPAVRWMGVISYVFYLSHLFWLDVAHGVAQGFAYQAALSVLLAFVLSLGFSSAVHWKLERPFAEMRRKLGANV